MNQYIGRVTEVFIPKQDMNGKTIDVMDSQLIGFKVLQGNEIIDTIQVQNEENVDIMRDDIVIITRQTNSNQEFISIERYDGDSDGL